MMKKCFLIYNPTSSRIKKVNMAKVKNIINSYGYDVKELRSEYAGHTIELVKFANEGDLTITLGGDGTIGEAVRAYQMIGKQKSIYGHIPTGTTNDTAANLGLSKKNYIKSLKSILNGNDYYVDVISANNCAFAYISCFGFLTNIPYETNKNLKIILGRFAYILKAFTNDILRKPHIFKLSYTINDVKFETDCTLCAVTNSKGFGGIEIYKEANINDGIFEVLMIKKLTIPLIIKLISDYLTNTFDFNKYKDDIIVFSTNKFKLNFINGVPSKPICNDGERASFSVSNEDSSITYEIKNKIKMRLPIKP